MIEELEPAVAEGRKRRFARVIGDIAMGRPDLAAAEAVLVERRRALATERQALDRVRAYGQAAALRADARLSAHIAAATAALETELDQARVALAAERAARSALEARLAGERAARRAADGELERLRAALTQAELPAPPTAGHPALPGLERAAVAALDVIGPNAVAEAAPAPPEVPPPATGASEIAARLEAAAEALRRRADESSEPEAPYQTPAAPPAVTRIVPPGPPVPLRLALVRLAQDDPETAAHLLAGLLPAQAAIVEGDVDYDFTIRGYGTFAVAVHAGAADVRRIAAPRPRRGAGTAAFHLAGDVTALAELVAGTRRRVGRFGRSARVRGRRRALGPVRAVTRSELSLAGAARAGATLDAAAVLRAAPYAIPPAWTRGHAFTVEHELTGPAAQTLYVTALDGRGVAVAGQHVGALSATVRVTPEAFACLLRREQVPAGHRPVVRGDREAVAVLRAWLDRCAGD